MSDIKSDIEIAREAKMLPIKDVLAKANVPDESSAFSPMGRHIEKVNLDQFDLAIICSPANMHVDAMKICAQNKLSFMVEKPLSTSMEGVDEIFN